MTKKPLTHIDCFSGPGGICTGLQAAGIKTVLAIEKVPSCVETYTANHPEVPVIVGDIRKVTAAQISEHVKGPVDILTSGMPCETFSTAGSKSRSFYDHRQHLFLEAIRIANYVKAKVILFENVPGMLSKKTELRGLGFVIDELYAALDKSGYRNHQTVVLNAADFGVPQLRQRLFVLAAKPGIPLRNPVANHDASARLSVSDAIDDLPPLQANGGRSESYLSIQNRYTKLMRDRTFWKAGTGKVERLTYHFAPNHRPGTLKRFKLIRQGDGLRDLFLRLSTARLKKLQKERVMPEKWYIQRNRRLVPNQPSVTVTSHCIDELVHPVQHRALTVREVARLQSFPDHYDFKGGPVICPHIYETQDKYEQVGDAVPPLLAYHWGLAMTKMLSVERSQTVSSEKSQVLVGSLAAI